MNALEILDILCRCDGVAGQENAAALKAMELLSPYAECKMDKMGNVVGTVGSGDEHILLDAHIDQIGLIVTGITDEGFLRFTRSGGVDIRTLTGSEVTVYGKEKVTGIICNLPADERKDGLLPDIDECFIDVGLSAETAKKLIPPGSFVSISQPPVNLQNGLFCSKSIDDRAGIAALILCAQALSGKELPCKVSFLFSCQEETGALGATTAAFSINPTRAVAVDVSFAHTPGCNEYECGKLSKGPMIGVSPVLNSDISRLLADLAKNDGMEHQVEVMGDSTGTNADDIAVTRCGVMCGLVSIPIKYMHTGVEVVDPKDITDTARLLELYVLKGGERNV